MHLYALRCQDTTHCVTLPMLTSNLVPDLSRSFHCFLPLPPTCCLASSVWIIESLHFFYGFTPLQCKSIWFFKVISSVGLLNKSKIESRLWINKKNYTDMHTELWYTYIRMCISEISVQSKALSHIHVPEEQEFNQWYASFIYSRNNTNINFSVYFTKN